MYTGIHEQWQNDEVCRSATVLLHDRGLHQQVQRRDERRDSHNRDELYKNRSSPGKMILRDYFQENMTSRRTFLLLRMSFSRRPILIQLPPAGCNCLPDCNLHTYDFQAI